MWDEYLKSYKLGGARGNGETVIITSWKCNYSIYLDIQAISTILCLLFIHFSIIQPLSRKVTFSGTQKPTPPTVFNLQAGFIVKRKQVRMLEYLGTPLNCYFFYKIFNLLFLPQKKCTISKNSIKFILFFFLQRDISAYVYTY